jgi:hypothetical protein
MVKGHQREGENRLNEQEQATTEEYKFFVLYVGLSLILAVANRSW